MMLHKTFRLVTVLAVIALGLGGGARSEANIIIHTPEGLSEGDTFRIVFVTPGRTVPTSSSIAHYNSFVTGQAGGATYYGDTVAWDAIGSTHSVNAIDNIGQTNTPVYLNDGQTLVTTSTTATGLWSGSLLHAINKDVSGVLRQNLVIFTGTTTAGVHSGNPLGGSLFGSVTIGASSYSNGQWVDTGTWPTLSSENMYGISEVLTVIPEPSTLWTALAGSCAAVGLGCLRRRESRCQT
jgi:hypothetical protein